MNLIKTFLGLALILPVAILAQTRATITVQNNSVLDRNETVVAIKWENVLFHFPKIDTSNFVVINPITKKQIPFQLEYQ
jgi:S-adenosylmethionine synthetase